jgi:hypothetical protein
VGVEIFLILRAQTNRHRKKQNGKAFGESDPPVLAFLRVADGRKPRWSMRQHGAPRPDDEKECWALVLLVCLKLLSPFLASHRLLSKFPVCDQARTGLLHDIPIVSTKAADRYCQKLQAREGPDFSLRALLYCFRRISCSACFSEDSLIEMPVDGNVPYR